MSTLFLPISRLLSSFVSLCMYGVLKLKQVKFTGDKALFLELYTGLFRVGLTLLSPGFNLHYGY